MSKILTTFNKIVIVLFVVSAFILGGMSAYAQTTTRDSKTAVTIESLLRQISEIRAIVHQLGGVPKVLGATTVSTVAEFDAAIKKAVSGDVIYLSPGVYNIDTFSGGTYRITDRIFSATNPVIIRSALASNPAVILSGDLQITGTTGLKIENVKITNNKPGRGYSSPMMTIRNSKNVTFAGTVFRGYVLKDGEGTKVSQALSRDIPISGYPYGGGVHVFDSSYVTLDTVDMADFVINLVFSESDNVTLRNSHIHHVRSDFLRIVGSQDVLVDNNQFNTPMGVHRSLLTSAPTADGDHVDGIQYYIAGTDESIERVVMSNNVFLEAGASHMQNMFGRGNSGQPGDFVRDFQYFNNVVYSTNPKGISIGDMQNAKIHHNTFIYAGGYEDESTNSLISAPTIELNEIENNGTANKPELALRNFEIHDNIIGYTNAFTKDSGVSIRDEAKNVTGAAKVTFMKERNIVMNNNVQMSSKASDPDSFSKLLKNWNAGMVANVTDLELNEAGKVFAKGAGSPFSYNSASAPKRPLLSNTGSAIWPPRAISIEGNYPNYRDTALYGAVPTGGGVPVEVPVTTVPKLGDTITSTSEVNVRSSYGLAALLLGLQPLGSTGVVISPVSQAASGFTWVQVNFANGFDGWVATTRIKVTAPTPTPTPTPIVTSFKIGDRISVNKNVNVRTSGLISATTLIGVNPQGSQGVIASGPTKSADGFIWFSVNFDSGFDGWVGADNYSLIIPTPAPTPEPAVNPNNLLSTAKIITSSNNFEKDHTVDNLFDGCTAVTLGCSTGSETAESFWVEFDLGASYDLSMARLFGDTKGTWHSKNWKLETKVTANSAYQTVFTGSEAFSATWFEKSVGVSARYVRVTVDGTAGSNKVQAMELELLGKLSPVVVPAPVIDTDKDSVPDNIDNCPNKRNDGQWDEDGDGVGNSCDVAPKDPNIGSTSNTASKPTVTFSTSQTNVTLGGSVTLNWSSVNATTCTASGGWTGSKSTSGSQSTGALSVVGTQIYSLSCTGAGGTVSQNVNVVVKSGSVITPTPTIVDTDKDGIVDTEDNCPVISNPTQVDTDKDGKGDVCDTTPTGTVVTPPTTSGSILGIKSNPKVLFVGNSYSYAAVTGDRDESAAGMFMRMLKLKAPGATHDLSVIGGSVMSELWNWSGRPAAMDPKNRLKSGAYDLVVLQSGDGLLSKGSQADYEKHTDLFANLAKTNGTDVMLYGIWAPDNMISIAKGETIASNAHAFYTSTAKRNISGYAASGMAYTQAYKKLTELYGKGDDGQTAETILTYDFVHPNPSAAYLAANMIYLAAFGVNPPTPSEFLPTGVTLSDANVLQSIAINIHKTNSIQLNSAWYK